MFMKSHIQSFIKSGIIETCIKSLIESSIYWIIHSTVYQIADRVSFIESSLFHLKKYKSVELRNHLMNHLGDDITSRITELIFFLISWVILLIVLWIVQQMTCKSLNESFVNSLSKSFTVWWFTTSSFDVMTNYMIQRVWPPI